MKILLFFLLIIPLVALPQKIGKWQIGQTIVERVNDSTQVEHTPMGTLHFKVEWLSENVYVLDGKITVTITHKTENGYKAAATDGKKVVKFTAKKID